jgi:hypothetical protein
LYPAEDKADKEEGSFIPAEEKGVEALWAVDKVTLGLLWAAI